MVSAFNMDQYGHWDVVRFKFPIVVCYQTTSNVRRNLCVAL